MASDTVANKNMSKQHAPTSFPKSTFPTRSRHLLQKLVDRSKGHTNGVSSKQAKVPLTITVVGGGLGGLTTSIALTRRGHKVTVLEKAENLGEVGAGIQIPPNSTRLLRAWGIDPFFEGKVTHPISMTIRRWKDGSPIAFTRLVPDFKDNYDGPYYVIHRADYLDALHKLARQYGVPVITNSRVVSFDEENGKVTIANGTTYSADLVVAADGVHSAARAAILGDADRVPQPTGFAAYRGTVDTELMKVDPDVSWLLEHPKQNVWVGEDHHVMSYCISGGRKFNMVLSHMDYSDPSTWSQDNIIEDMRKAFTGWDPKLVKLISMIKHALKWPLVSGSSLPTWLSKNRRLIIIGDAAHAMVPYMSQGAAMAVEDGAALAEILSLVSSKSEIAHALEIFERVRMDRTYNMQAASLVNGTLWHYPDGPEQQARDLGSRPEVEGRSFAESTNQWSDPTTQIWTYGYDAEKVVREAWRDATAARPKL